MRKIITIIGARPQIIKSAALSRAIKERFSTQLEEHLIHTGQHYDQRMSGIFFDEMGIPAPACNLNVGSGPHAWQTARMMEGIADTIDREHPDGLVIYGDTNSTLAGAIAASQKQIPVFHIEAGLRSFYMPMPEEQNRIVADHLSSICFAPTQTAMDNLQREGLVDSPAQFTTQRKKRQAILCGDVMLDNALYYMPTARRIDILQRYSLLPNGYILATIHRDFNADNRDRLDQLLTALDLLSKESSLSVVIPAHPRSSAALSSWIQEHEAGMRLQLIPPASYLEMLALEQGARIIATDSGGVQKEAYFCHKPCLILRHETEWKEIVDQRAAVLTDVNAEAIMKGFQYLETQHNDYPPLFGDGHAAEHIAEHIIQYIK